jgi:hypothetical protein
MARLTVMLAWLCWLDDAADVASSVSRPFDDDSPEFDFDMDSMHDKQQPIVSAALQEWKKD